MDLLHQTKSEGRFAPIDSERASIALRLVLMCGEFIKAGEPQKALEAYYHARDVLDGLANSQPYNVDLGLTLSLLHLKIGDLMRARGDSGEANEAYRSSLAIAERLAVFQPGNEDLQRNQAEALAALSTVSGASEFGSKLDCAKNHLKGFPAQREALASATDGRVEAPAPVAEVEAVAECRLTERPWELSLEVRDRTTLDDLPGQFIHNIPRRMRVGALETAEVRLPHRQGADAITVRLRAPEGGFLIDPLSSETWQAKGDGNGYASWQWSVTPQRRGRAHLHLITSAQTLAANGSRVDAALPDHVIEV